MKLKFLALALAICSALPVQADVLDVTADLGNLDAETTEMPLSPLSVQYIRCESRSHRYNECWYWSRWAYRVRLVQVHSRAVCSRGYSYGWTNRFVWVDNGCRATFAVYGY